MLAPWFLPSTRHGPAVGALQAANQGQPGRGSLDPLEGMEAVVADACLWDILALDSGPPGALSLGAVLSCGVQKGLQTRADFGIVALSWGRPSLPSVSEPGSLGAGIRSALA